MYFIAADPANSTRQLWRSDGTPGGTVMVAGDPGDPFNSLGSPVLACRRLFFGALTQDHGGELWVLDIQAPPIEALNMIPSGAGAVDIHVSVNPNGLSTSAWIEFGLTSSYGSQVNVSFTPDNGTSPRGASAVVLGLPPDTEYHFRLVSTNSSGTACTADSVFTPITVSPVQ